MTFNGSGKVRSARWRCSCWFERKRRVHRTCDPAEVPAAATVVGEGETSYRDDEGTLRFYRCAVYTIDEWIKVGRRTMLGDGPKLKFPVAHTDERIVKRSVLFSVIFSDGRLHHPRSLEEYQKLTHEYRSVRIEEYRATRPPPQPATACEIAAAKEASELAAKEAERAASTPTIPLAPKAAATPPRKKTIGAAPADDACMHTPMPKNVAPAPAGGTPMPPKDGITPLTFVDDKENNSNQGNKMVGPGTPAGKGVLAGAVRTPITKTRRVGGLGSKPSMREAVALALHHDEQEMVAFRDASTCYIRGEIDADSYHARFTEVFRHLDMVGRIPEFLNKIKDLKARQQFEMVHDRRCRKGKRTIPLGNAGTDATDMASAMGDLSLSGRRPATSGAKPPAKGGMNFLRHLIPANN